MNLKRIDAAIAAYESHLDEADRARLAFFRTLWGVQDAHAADVEVAYEVPAPRALLDAAAAERAVLLDAPVTVDFDALARTTAELAATAAEQTAFSDDVARALERVKWDRVFRASEGVLAGADPSAWLQNLAEVLVDDGMTENAAHVAALFASMALKVQLERPAARIMDALKTEGAADPRPLLCPVCGSAPTLAHVGGATSSSGRGRVLVCPQCAAAWEFERVRCARCGTHGQTKLHFFNVEGDDDHRIATCDECGGYIRTRYSEDTLVPCSYEVEDVVMARLDAIAQDPRMAGGSADGA